MPPPPGITAFSFAADGCRLVRLDRPGRVSDLVWRGKKGEIMRRSGRCWAGSAGRHWCGAASPCGGHCRAGADQSVDRCPIFCLWRARSTVYGCGDADRRGIGGECLWYRGGLLGLAGGPFGAGFGPDQDRAEKSLPIWFRTAHRRPDRRRPRSGQPVFCAPPCRIPHPVCRPRSPQQFHSRIWCGTRGRLR